MTGLSDVIGSWKIIEISLPRMRCISFSPPLAELRPRKKISPPTIRPTSLSSSRMIESAVTLLPQPDSPTRPTVSPSAISKLTPLTALTSPSLVKNDVRKSLTRNRGSLLKSWPRPSTTRASLSQSRRSVVDERHPAVDDGHIDRDVFDPLRCDGERILRQHRKIGELAGFDRAFDTLVKAIVGG